MQIHLSDVIFSEGKTIQATAELEMERIVFQLGDFPILEKSPLFSLSRTQAIKSWR